MENYLRTRFLVGYLPLLLALSAVNAHPPVADINKAEQDARLAVQSLLNYQDGQALELSKTALRADPAPRIAHLLYADLLSVYAHNPPLFATPMGAQKKRVADLRSELALRVGYQPPSKNHLPDAVLKMSSEHPYLLLLDTAKARLYLLKEEKGRPHLVASYYASVGSEGMGKKREGDNKTPLGVYRLMSYLPGETLPELYGAGAWTIDFPNYLDKLEGKNGYGIWLHGMPASLESRPPKDSRGCVIVGNPVINELSKFINPSKTRMVLTEEVKWLYPEVWEEIKNTIYQNFQQWLADWRSLDVEKYLSHYSRSYVSEGMNYKKFVEQTRRNALKKTFIKVTAEELEILAFPGDETAYMLIFDQDYRSNNYQINYRKKQLWKKNKNEEWKIAYENRA